MRVGSQLRKQINDYIRGRHYGRSPYAEVGMRGDPPAPNALKWDMDEDDLDHLVLLRDLTEIDEVAAYPGKATLDLYVTAFIPGGMGDPHLWGNVYAFVKDGALAVIYDDDCPLDRRITIETEFLAS